MSIIWPRVFRTRGAHYCRLPKIVILLLRGEIIVHGCRRLGGLWARVGCHLEDVTIGVALQRSVVAGVDGRSPHEVRMLVRIGPWLAQELYDVWREATSVGVATPTEACEKLRSVRTVGTPKGDGNEAQPISVAYVWARAWHNALLWCLLVALDDQWYCRAGESVVLCTADWLAHPKMFDQSSTLSMHWARWLIGFCGVPLRMCTCRSAWWECCYAIGRFLTSVRLIVSLPLRSGQRAVCHREPLARPGISPQSSVLGAPMARRRLYMGDRTLDPVGVEAEQRLRNNAWTLLLRALLSSTRQ